MVVQPNATQLATIARDLGFNFDDSDLGLFRAMLAGPLSAYARLDALPEALPKPRYPRLPGHAPAALDNPFGAYARLIEIRGADSGPLAGRQVAVKDCICVAGVPTMNGSATFDGYVPEIDATVVTRLLDAGAILVGKTANEDFCYSGGSHTNARGPVDNPWKHGYTAGGSSSGSAAVVGGGLIDIALGTDQGGSVRGPASCCGVVGMKPTFGLVPCTGNLGMEYSLDHIGPITTSVADNALVLSVIAGPDGLDTRQAGVVVDDYRADLFLGVNGLRIGLLREGFARPQSDPRVDAAVRAAAERLVEAGATLVEVSVPLHADAGAIWLPRAAEGCLATIFHGNGFGHGPKGVYLPSAMHRQSLWRGQADLLADTVKLGMLVGEYMRRTYGGRYYGRAHNLGRLLTAAYDEALASVDVIIMPTLPTLPPKRPTAEDLRETWIAAAFDMTVNTSAFNATGHPSLSLPCAVIEGLPVGMMITGAMCAERMIYRVAAAVERALGDLGGRPRGRVPHNASAGTRSTLSSSAAQ
jgi:amidase